MVTGNEQACIAQRMDDDLKGCRFDPIVCLLVDRVQERHIIL